MLLSDIYVIAVILLSLAIRVESTIDDSPKYEWKALVGSFASSGSSSESDSLQVQQHSPGRHHHQALPEDPVTNPTDKSSDQSIQKAKNREKYLRLKQNPERLKRTQERNKDRKRRLITLQNEWLDTLPEETKEKYVKIRQRNNTEKSRFYRKQRFEKLKKLPVQDRNAEIERQRRLRKKQYERSKMKKQG